MKMIHNPLLELRQSTICYPRILRIESGYEYYVNKFPAWVTKSSYLIEDKKKWEAEYEEKDSYKGLHYFIDEIANIDQNDLYMLKHARQIIVMASENYSWEDMISFGAIQETLRFPFPFLHLTGKEPLSRILAICGFFPTSAAAKSAGWFKPIPPGYSEIKLGKKQWWGTQREVIFWNPQISKFSLDSWVESMKMEKILIFK